MNNKQQQKNVPNIHKLEDLISLKEAAEFSGLSPSYLRILVRNGQIWGLKIGRNWVTTEKVINEFLASERKPGRPPKQLD